MGFFLFLKVPDEEPCHVTFCISVSVVCSLQSFSVMARPLVLIEIPWDIHHDALVTLIPQTPSSLMPSLASSRNGGCRLALKHKTDMIFSFYVHNLTVTDLLILSVCQLYFHLALLISEYTPTSYIYPIFLFSCRINTSIINLCRVLHTHSPR